MTGNIVALHHVTHYRYDRPVRMGAQTIRLRPAPHVRPSIRSYSLNISPSKHFINWQQDAFGNFLAKVVFPEKIREFKVEVDLLAEMRVFNPFDFFLEPSAQYFPFAYERGLKEELAPYLEIKESGRLLKSWLRGVPGERCHTIEFLVGLNQKLHGQLQYGIRMEPGVQHCEDTLRLGSGSCRDMAWLLCQLLRHLGLATRFASGYLMQLKTDSLLPRDTPGPEEDFADLHAWTEVFLPGAGWVGLDPTSGLLAGEGHIPLCCTPNPGSAAPISGALEACESSMSFDMKLTRIFEKPDVARPYSNDDWKAIDRLGAEVDKVLKKQDVRLSMGGEPTFISLDDRKSQHWNFTALGENKERLGNALLLRLRDAFAPGGLLQYTQGKWCPGEILPRWAMQCYWRTDGEPVWRNPALLANPHEGGRCHVAAAGKFLRSLAKRLGIPASYVLPAHEDTVYYLWKEGRMPLDVGPSSSGLSDEAERKRLQALMDTHLGEACGFVLPLFYSPKRKRWVSNRWRFKSRKLVLLPGDSPLGLRLPLGSLPQVHNDEVAPERSPFEEVGELPSHKKLARDYALSDASFRKDENGYIKTALCGQVRDGVLYAFLPPVAYCEHFLELVASLEAVAAEMDVALALEGYSPPADVRLRSFSVTPDPGVLEVNVQPAADWEALKQVTFTVYREAFSARLGTEKFLLDGRCAGTGGGSHIVLGAMQPADSPFLRRPALLRSLVAFWQNHPSLSYLFSGQYIGPTSQAPRIDEARHDSLYELEIAFSQVPQAGETPPWLVDRLFRNLLIDATGNTHRAEFCIDKMYSPEGGRGRLGLLEMRGFEMPPHPQMQLLQALLVRAAVALFWKTPYLHSLVRWGTRLHDDFMLPHYIEEDFQTVLATLQPGGYDFQPHWFEPFFHFRFPEYGTFNAGGMTVELRMALEPWHVMGEESVSGGTSRAVDASVERLQVKVSGVSGGRYVLACNGRRVPLHATRIAGVHVAGVRYKAWPFPSSLHPNIPPHVPLVFDVIDTHHEKSLGGCTYHVAHPGGRNYEGYPLNANEAEGRRLARFQPMGHTPGKIKTPLLEPNPDFPHTLDLRFPLPL